MISSGSILAVDNKELEDRFPYIDYDFEPFGNRVFVQMRYPVFKTKGGVELDSDTVENAYRNEQVGIVRGLGESCFTFMTNGNPWPSGRRFEVGDYLRCPVHGGDNHWEILKLPSEHRPILFKIFKDYEIIGKHKNPLNVATNYAYF